MIRSFIALSLIASVVVGQTGNADEPSTRLLDPTLSKWEKWMGVPHSSVEGLPEGTYQSDNVHQGEPLGLNKDPKNVFTIENIAGETVLRVSGEIYGGLTTKESFSNYHLKLKMRWGKKRWAPRADTIRDSGILYHCHGKHGSFWRCWKSCIEYQVQEKDFGDLYLLAGPRADVRSKSPKDGKGKSKFDPAGKYRTGVADASSEPDRPLGEWNEIEIYVVGDSAVHVVNGVVVLALKNATDKNGNRLDKGQIQIQSEAAECFYKDIVLSPIEAFPAELAKAAGFDNEDSE